LLEGTKGIGVVLAESNKAAESVINAFKSLKADILVQEYIKESKGRDIRCFVVGDQVVAAMERQAEEGEFRANMHLGGKAIAVQITDEERAIAIKAVKTIGLDIAGVDMVRSNFGPKILEVNSSPGLEGIEAASGVDIADKIIEFLEKQIS
jgi:ribosomal protein S6--L-glutamate ligase